MSSETLNLIVTYLSNGEENRRQEQKPKRFDSLIFLQVSPNSFDRTEPPIGLAKSAVLSRPLAKRSPI